ncbi:hypothetical protein SCP_1302790 [Sparassis crispa]|uniref:Uncharacterized protein n=1 Tax=Sparassis crispa TaxID=139825 RepID=A0A401H223_9APHY|nr:hypothetical protein SCP_1302790 [Sparassis crispa]GBE88464.1 hypothetical protein SCP_1302790 [Sparassis crispa]
MGRTNVKKPFPSRQNPVASIKPSCYPPASSHSSQKTPASLRASRPALTGTRGSENGNEGAVPLKKKRTKADLDRQPVYHHKKRANIVNETSDEDENSDTDKDEDGYNSDHDMHKDNDDNEVGLENEDEDGEEEQDMDEEQEQDKDKEEDEEEDHSRGRKHGFLRSTISPTQCHRNAAAPRS